MDRKKTMSKISNSKTQYNNSAARHAFTNLQIKEFLCLGVIGARCLVAEYHLPITCTIGQPNMGELSIVSQRTEHVALIPIHFHLSLCRLSKQFFFCFTETFVS